MISQFAIITVAISLSYFGSIVSALFYRPIYMVISLYFAWTLGPDNFAALVTVISSLLFVWVGYRRY